MNTFPLYAPDQLLPAMRDFLATNGLVRKPDDPGPLPPCWLDPKKGIPYPGEQFDGNQSHPDLVLALYPATGIPSQPYEGFLVRLGVAVWYRGRVSPIIQTKHEQIRSALHDQRNINMSGLLVNQAQLSREIQRIGSDERGYVYNCEIMFDLWNSDYAYS